MRSATVTVVEVAYTFNGNTKGDGSWQGAEINLRGSWNSVESAVHALGLATSNIQRDESTVEVISLGDFLFDLGNYLKNGSKINAIKRVREVTGLGLKESKDLVDNLSFKPENPF